MAIVTKLDSGTSRQSSARLVSGSDTIAQVFGEDIADSVVPPLPPLARTDGLLASGAAFVGVTSDQISQIQQARARGGAVIAVATEGDELVQEMADQILWVPETPWMLSPVVTVIPLQILAYHIAAIRGLDVDQPRNLAKSVTVE